MSSRRIGEILSNLVPLSEHDIEDILSEQSASRKRFGDIALSMGLCRPEHTWQACSTQLDAGPQLIDLDALGIDTQAIEHLPAKTARALEVVPVRVFGDELLIATHAHSLNTAADVLPIILTERIKFVLAEREQIEQALAAYYPRLPSAPTESFPPASAAAQRSPD